jgi:hypothetical protein
MSMITDVWQQLVQRRLWPLAVLLVGALVAVPVVLSKDPAPEPVPASPLPAVSASKDNATADPVVQLADEGALRRRRVLGVRKDPFKPAPTPKPKATPTPDSTPAPTGGVTGGSPTPGGGSSPVVGPVSPVYPTTPTAPHKKKSYPGDSLTVRFSSGDATGVAKSVLESDQGLPTETADDENPLLVYTGLAKGGKVAVFLVDASVTADGDGRCDGDSDTDCETLYLRAGDTEFLDVTDDAGNVTGQFQLDLLAIHPSKKTRAAAAKSAKAAKAAKAHKHLAKDAKAVTAAIATAAGAAAAHQRGDLGAGIGALLAGL